MNPAPKYKDLTPPQKAFVDAEIVNGCGTKAMAWLVPDLLQTDACNAHDYEYWLGGTKLDKRIADREFFAAMKLEAKKAPWWQFTGKYARAWGFYLAVRFGGEAAFGFGDRATVSDLEMVVKVWQRKQQEASE